MGWRNFAGGAGWLKLGLAVAAALAVRAAQAQPANDNFANATAIYGYTGSTSGNNAGATLEACEPPQITITTNAKANVTNSVWFAWTPPAGGTVTFDTIGSSFETVLAVYTTANGLCDPSLKLVAANDNTNYPAQNSSQVSFYATNGITYYISVSGNLNAPPTNGAAGGYVLNWNLPPAPGGAGTLSSGSFLFTLANYEVSAQNSSASITVTRAGPANGRVLVDYAMSNLTYINNLSTNYWGTNVLVTITATNGTITTNDIYLTNIVFINLMQYYQQGNYLYDTNTGAYTNYLAVSNGVPPFRRIVTGPLTPFPTNYPQTTYYTTNVVTYTNSVDNSSVVSNTILFAYSVTTNQVVTSNPGNDITLQSGTLAFDDFQMSQDFLVTVADAGQNGLVQITLSNLRLDPMESADLMPPTISPAGAIAQLDTISLSKGSGGGTTFDFSFSTAQVDKDISPPYITISVLREGSTAGAASVQYAIDQASPIGQYNPANQFPLQAGSDYATPGSDFTSESGTLNWGANDGNAKTFDVPILNNGLVEFNSDLQLQLHNPSQGASLGPIKYATVTILFDDLDNGQQPAGAVDRFWNLQNNLGSIPPNISYPGTTGNGGMVYAAAEQPNGEVIIAGNFTSFDQNPYNRIVRLLSNGYQDPTFLVSPNSGANNFISALALQPNGSILIGGNFTAFNGNDRHRIARLNSDGSLDGTFNPGLGADGTVWSIALVNRVVQQTNILNEGGGLYLTNVVVMTNAQIVIGGDFTSVNGIGMNHVAVLNMDGSVDTTFNPGIGPDGTVNAVAVDFSGRIIIGGNFDQVSGVISGGVSRLNADGTVDSTFNPGIATYNPFTGETDPVYAIAVQSDGRILIAGGFSWLDLVSYNGIARLNPDGTVDTAFSPGSGTYNPITGVTDPVYAMQLAPDGKILIGGYFTTFNQTRRVGVARLFTDGTVDTSFMDTAYNQFAGLINHYHNPDAVNASLYPASNTRNYVNAFAQEPWVTNTAYVTNVVVNPTNSNAFITNVTTTHHCGGRQYYHRRQFFRCRRRWHARHHAAPQQRCAADRRHHAGAGQHRVLLQQLHGGQEYWRRGAFCFALTDKRESRNYFRDIFHQHRRAGAGHRHS